MSRALLAVAFALVVVPLAGCFGGGSGFDFTPGGSFKPTGKTVHLAATVVDLAGSELYPGFKANLWAFCFQAVDPNDAYSVAAIEYWTPLAGDATGAGHDKGQCTVPGPTLRVHQGDRIIVEFAHSHFHPHTIHWHGQFVPWESDGAPGVTQEAVPSGGSITYDFIAKRAGTLWYHCHVDTQTHVMQGLYGMMIVEPQDTKYEPKDIAHDDVMILSTMNRNAVEAVPGAGLHNHPPGCASGFSNCINPPSQAGKPDVFLLNGHSYPYTMDQEQTLYKIKEGQRIRIRILNAGETVEEVHLHGHDMQVVAEDGNPLPPAARYFVDTITVGPAQRFDVVIEGNNPGPWMIHTHIASHETNCGISPGGMHTMLVYEGYEDKMHQFASELPASCPFGSQMQLPSDFTNSTSFALGMTPSVGGQSPAGPVSGSWSWPVKLPCAVRRLGFFAHLDPGSNPLGSNVNNVQVDVKDSAGTVVFSQKLSNTELSGSYVLEKGNLKDIPITAGNYTVSLSGSSADAHLDLEVQVDYYETFEQSKTAHLTYKVGGCPGYT